MTSFRRRAGRNRNRCNFTPGRNPGRGDKPGAHKFGIYPFLPPFSHHTDTHSQHIKRKLCFRLPRRDWKRSDNTEKFENTWIYHSKICINATPESVHNVRWINHEGRRIALLWRQMSDNREFHNDLYAEKELLARHFERFCYTPWTTSFWVFNKICESQRIYSVSLVWWAHLSRFVPKDSTLIKKYHSPLPHQPKNRIAYLGNKSRTRVGKPWTLSLIYRDYIAASYQIVW